MPPQFEQAPQPGLPPQFEQAPQPPAPAKTAKRLLIGGLVLAAITALLFREQLTPMIIHPERTIINALMDVAKTNKLALRQLQSLAEQGNAVAENDLGLLYFKGEGVSKDSAEAVRWLRKAADQGYANAQSNLGIMYAKGEGVSKDSAEAVKWWRKAADQGDALAQKQLASITVFPFAETPRDFEKYLNSLNWGSGKSVKFNHLDRCESRLGVGYGYYRCDSGFVVIKDPRGTRTCSLGNYRDNFAAAYDGKTPSYNTGECTESHGWW